MPKAKKVRGRPKSEDKVAPISENKPCNGPRKKQKVAPEHQGSRSIDGAPHGRFETRIRIEPTPSQLTIVNGDGKAIRVPASSEVYFNRKGVKHVRPREIQELRGYPDHVTTVTNEAFKYLDDDLQSNLRDVFHGLNDVLEPGSAFTDPSYPLIGRRTRATAQEYDQFFKTLIPKELTPEQDDHIMVQFNGTSTITTDAPGYTEIVRFGDGRWSRTRNGIIETGRLEDVDIVRIAEQTKQMIDGIMRHTASGLAGMMNPDRMVEPLVRSPRNRGTTD